MPFLTTAALVASLAGAAAKAGGSIAASQKLKNGQSPEELYAQRYGASFRNAMNASLAAQATNFGGVNNAAAQAAQQQAALSNLGNEAVGASRAATNDARAYANMAMQGQQRDAAAAQQMGNSIGGGFDALGMGLGGMASANMAEQAATVAHDRQMQLMGAMNGVPATAMGPEAAGRAAQASQQATTQMMNAPAPVAPPTVNPAIANLGMGVLSPAETQTANSMPMLLEAPTAPTAATSNQADIDAATRLGMNPDGFQRTSPLGAPQTQVNTAAGAKLR